MSAGKLSLLFSPTATAQIAMMTKAEMLSLKAFFANETGLPGPNTKPLRSGGLVSRVGNKRVLWRRRADNKAEIQTIIDESYARSRI